jgi:hypothetical protein
MDLDKKGWKGIGAVEIAIGGAVILGIGVLGYWTATRLGAANERIDKLECKIKELEKAMHDHKKTQALTNKDLAKKVRAHSQFIEEADITNTITKIQESMAEIEDRLESIDDVPEKPEVKPKKKNKKSVKPKKPVVKPKKTEDTEEDEPIENDDEENYYDLL